MEIESSKTRNVSLILTIAILLAGIFDYLFFQKELGISVVIYAGLLIGILYWLSAKFRYNSKSSLWLMVSVVFFAIMPAIRANMFLNFLNILAIIGLLVLTSKELLLEHINKFGLKEYFITVFRFPFRLLTNAVKPLRYAINSFLQSSTQKWRRVLIGIVIALPVLLVFTILFSAADLAFGQFVNSIISLHIPDVFFGHVIVISVIFVILLGTMEYIFHASTGLPVTPVSETQEIATSGREVETRVFLSLIAVLFVIFIIFQVTYLFGGDANIISRGFTYAEYARRGFWELLAVAAATLVILFFTDKFTARIGVSRKTWFTIPAIAIILEIFVIIISAFKRLALYQGAYGLTELRFYVAGFIIFLGVVFVLLAVKFAWAKAESFFTFATLLTMIVFLVGVNFINPDAFIARKNIARFHETGKIDASYLSNLSADAAPQIVDSYE
jgi:hypothetical protein